MNSMLRLIFVLAAGMVSSAVAQVAITTQPQSTAVTVGQPVTLSVVASGTAPLAYQWKKNAVDIPGETNASYSIVAATTADAGIYTVSVTDGQPSTVLSSQATLTVNLISQALTFSPPATKTYGDTSFAVSATSDSGLPVTISVVSGPASINSGTVTLTGVGTVVLRASQAGDATRAVATLDRTIAVAPRPITVTAAAKTKVFGTADPALTYTLSSGTLVGSDQLTGSLARVAGETVAGGPYAITQGTVTAGANYSVTFVSANLSITKATPIITWAPPASVPPGTALSATQLNATAVPPGGTFVYTPAVGVTLPTSGAYTLSVQYTLDPSNYNVMSATQAITVAPLVPVISSAVTATATVGTAFSYAVTATNNPTSFAASGLPAGLSINSTTGVISGTPTAVGSSSISLRATNSVGSSSAVTLALTVSAVPVINSAVAATAKLGTAFSYTITASNSPTAFAASGLPAGLTLNPTTGVISGTPTALGVSNVSLTASNAGATSATVNLVLTVNAGPTFTTQPQSQIATAPGDNITFNVAVTGSPTPTLQWYFNGALIAGATNAYLNLTNVQASAVGKYWAVAVNSEGSVKSSVAAFELTQAGNSATQTVVGTGYIAGSVLTFSNTLNYSGTASALSWSVLLPAGWSFAASTGSPGDQGPAVGTTDLLEWVWTNVPPSPVTFTFSVNVPANSSGTKELVTIAGVRNGTSMQFLAQPDPLVVQQVATHSADSDRNLQLSMLELSRVIELYNTRNGTNRTGSYAVATTATEDGFIADTARSPTATVTLARYHSGDSNRDGKISMLELTRVVELYNYRAGPNRTGQYHAQSGTEDGFAAGP